MRLLGIDYGDRRIGLAISDEMGLIAHKLPLIEISNMDEAIQNIVVCIEEKNISEVVIGLPKNMNDTIGPRAEIVLDFVEQLKNIINIPIVTWDERLTTMQAEEILSITTLSRKKKKGHLNTVSAQIILQSYLDAKRTKAT